ncbi:hypothetical protein H9623_14685 [Oerskovia sp. Sa1BUA8]|uniref:Uncharacterized protein n=1 Tax=Oerskovia douganii TaxID=2762210 RepID=A0A9D5UCK4_9CELL|nr:hypothetical protein [Oerskovia douganii]MBE7701536.1 hypothetical protein [Oerskovia douganii]
MPPKLSATALFWWGAGLIVAGVVGTLVLPHLFSRLGYATGFAFVQSVVGLVSALVSVAHVVGAGLVAAAFTVRALGRDTNDRYTGPAPYSPAKPGNEPPR